MKTKLGVLFFLLVIFTSLNAQSNQEIDSLAFEICKMVELENSIIISDIYEKHLNSFLESSLATDKDSLSLIVLFRLEKTCSRYSELAYERSELKSDWELLKERPIQLITDAECMNFFLFHEFKYLESNGDTVNLKIKDGFWIDYFDDGTYSKLELISIDPCNFEIQFIESNNGMRSKFSRKGDKYRY